MVPIDAPNFIASAIARAGFKAAFAVPGVPITETLTALRLQKQCLLAICRNEQQAANAAAAYGFYSGTDTLTNYEKELTQCLEAAATDAATAAAKIFGVPKVGSPALCLSTSGPAFMNGLGGVATAQVNNWPMVFLASSSGNVNTNWFGVFMEYPQMNVAEKLVSEGVFKAAFRVQTPIELYVTLLKAREAALTGQPGVVYVDVDHQVFRCGAQALIEEAASAMNAAPLPQPIPRVQPGTNADKMVNAVLSSKRPLLIVGKGLAYSAGEPVTWLFDQVKASLVPIPILASPMGKGIVSEGDRRNAAAARRLVMTESDCVVALGARLNWMFDPASGWTDNKQVFCCCLAPQLPVELRDRITNVQGDATLLLLKLLTAYLKSPGNSSHVEWLNSVATKTEAAAKKLQEAKESQTHDPVQFPKGQRRFTGGLKYAQAFTALETAIAKDTKVPTGSAAVSSAAASSAAVDSALLSAWLGPGMRSAVTWVVEGAVSMDKSRLFVPGTVAKCRLDAATFAGMGVGAPFALGAALWRSVWLPVLAEYSLSQGVSKGVVDHMMAHSFVSLVQGDSAFGFSGLEFETVFRYKLPILLTVVDNGGMYAMSDNEPLDQTHTAEHSDSHIQRLQLTSVCDLTPNFEFAKLAQACQGTGLECRSLKDYQGALKKYDVCKVDNLPILMHVRIDPMDGSGAGFVHHL